MNNTELTRKHPHARHYKGGRTAHFPGVRLTPAHLEKLRLILHASDQTVADWVEKRIDEAYLQWIRDSQ